MTKGVTEQEIREMLNQPEPDEAQKEGPLVPPVTIHKIDGTSLICDKLGAWKQDASGIFAVGRWATDDEDIERDIAIPNHRVDYLEFNFKALKAEYEAALADAD